MTMQEVKMQYKKGLKVEQKIKIAQYIHFKSLTIIKRSYEYCGLLTMLYNCFDLDASIHSFHEILPPKKFSRPSER